MSSAQELLQNIKDLQKQFDPASKFGVQFGTLAKDIQKWIEDTQETQKKNDITKSYTELDNRVKRTVTEFRTILDSIQKDWERISISALSRKSAQPGNKPVPVDLDTIKLVLNQKRPNIFLSYCHDQKSEAVDLENVLLASNMKVIRDEKSLHYMDNYTDFMKKVRTTNFVLLLISDNYLKSSKCMYEILELRKDDNYKNRIMLVVHISAKPIYDIKGSLEYVNYWDTKLKELEQAMIGLTLEESGELGKELRQLRNTKNEIINFIQEIKILLVPPLDDLKKTSYLPILQRIYDTVTK